MNINGYEFIEYEKGINILVEKKTNINNSDMIINKPFVKNFYFVNRHSGITKINFSIYEDLYAKLGFKDLSDKIATIVYENEEQLLKFIAKRNPELIHMIAQLIDNKHNESWLLNLYKLAETNMISLNIKGEIKKNESLEYIFPQPFISFQHLTITNNNRKFKINNFSRKKKNIRMPKQQHKKNIIRNFSKINFDNLNLLTTAIIDNLTYCIGKIDTTENLIKFSTGLELSKKRYRDNFADDDSYTYMDFYKYDGYDMFYSKDIDGDNYDSVIIFDFSPLTYSFLKAEYLIIPKSKSKKITATDNWPDIPYMLHPWYLPVKRNRDIKIIESQYLPECANNKTYFPGKKQLETKIKIDKPIYFTKIDLGI